MSEEINTAVQFNWNQLISDIMPYVGTLLGGVLGYFASLKTQKASLIHNEKMLDKRFEYENENKFHKEKIDLYTKHTSYAVRFLLLLNGNDDEREFTESFEMYLEQYEKTQLIGHVDVVNSANTLHDEFMRIMESFEDETSVTTEDEHQNLISLVQSLKKEIRKELATNI